MNLHSAKSKHDTTTKLQFHQEDNQIVTPQNLHSSRYCHKIYIHQDNQIVTPSTAPTTTTSPSRALSPAPTQSASTGLNLAIKSTNANITCDYMPQLISYNKTYTHVNLTTNLPSLAINSIGEGGTRRRTETTLRSLFWFRHRKTFQIWCWR